MDKPNWEILSVTRFFLASIVMVDHLSLFSPTGYLQYFANLGSFEAILGFLLISGFSIGHSVKRDSQGYFKRRIQRIYPVYFASIIFQIMAVGIQFNIGTIFILLINLLFLNQILTDTSFVGPSWTLATEVGLYLLAPFLIKKSKKTLIIYALISFALYIFYTCGRTLFHWNYYSGTKYGINIPILAFIWIVGFTIAVFPENRSQNSKLIGLVFAGHILLSIGIQTLSAIKHHNIASLVSNDLIIFISHSLCLLIVYLVIMNKAKIKVNNVKVKKLFNMAGNVSYPLYLTHWISFYLMSRLNFQNTFVLISGALLIAFVIYYIFDFYSKKRRIIA